MVTGLTGLMTAVAGLDLALLGLVLWTALRWPKVRRVPTEEKAPDISVLIPARNEAAHIEACLAAVLAGADGVIEVLVYDDHSTDDTAARVMRAGQDDDRVRLISPDPLPPGWCGKPFACSRLAAAASGGWLLFIDADVRLHPGAPGAMVAAARRNGATFLSCWPGLDLVGFWEKLLMPMLNFVVFTLFPAPRSLRDGRPSLGLAHGACIVVCAEEYRATGGHGAVRGELFEDTMLARHWRVQGRVGICLDGQEMVRVRMYERLGDIWPGFRKNFRPAFRTEVAFWCFWCFHALVFVAPFLVLGLAAAGRAPLPAAYGAGVAVMAVLGMRLVQAVQFRYPLWSVLLHPAGEIALLVLGLDSWFSWRLGRGVAWKGRRYNRTLNVR